jgi:hypothetical protein
MRPFFYLSALLFSTFLQAQTFPDAVNFTAGDKLTYQTKASGKSSKYEFIFTETSASQVRGTASIDGKQMEFESPAHGYLGKEFCLADVMECEWSPPVKLFDKTTKVGDKWTATTNIKLKNNTVVDEVIEFKAEKFEKIKVPAGEFESIRVNANGTIKAKVEKGDVYTGTLKMTTWFGIVNNRVVMIKREYTNSFKQPFSQELAKQPEITN